MLSSIRGSAIAVAKLWFSLRRRWARQHVSRRHRVKVNRTVPYLSLSLSLLLASGRAVAVDVTMAFGDNLPPYILSASDAGIEVEIVRAALAYRGHVLRAKFLPM